MPKNDTIKFLIDPTTRMMFFSTIAFGACSWAPNGKLTGKVHVN
jgi:hypothetical protein